MVLRRGRIHDLRNFSPRLAVLPHAPRANSPNLCNYLSAFNQATIQQIQTLDIQGNQPK